MKSRFSVLVLILAVGFTCLECKQPDRALHLAGAAPGQMRIVRVEVTGDGAVFIEGRECPWPELGQRLRVIRDKQAAVLYLCPAADASDVSGFFGSILEASAEAGWTQVSLRSHL